MNQSEISEEMLALIQSAKQGNAAAQNNLGWMYQQNEGNIHEANVWYRRSAEQGYSHAQNNIGAIYQNGLGVEQNDSEAVKWYRKAAEQNNILAQYNLGCMYRNGRGVDQNDNEAIFWFRKSAEQNYAYAQNALGWMYHYGKGVDISLSDAVAWYRKAAQQEHVYAMFNMGFMCKNGEGIDPNLTEAVSWYRKAAEHGDANSQFNLGLMYIFGDGVEKDYIQAKELFHKAATTLDPELRFKAIEYQDRAERYELSEIITVIRGDILHKLKADITATPTMTHYTSLMVGDRILFEKSPLRLGHINALNDPNEGKLLWRYLGHTPVEGKPAFVGCYLPDDDSLNMWRFYSKNHNNDDACGCAITFNTDDFFKFNLLSESSASVQQDEGSMAFANTGKSPQESSAFYRIIYISDDMNIHDNDKINLEPLFEKLKDTVKTFLGDKPGDDKLQQLSRLLGPLPYLLKDADYEAEKEHRVIVTHLEYGAKEIQTLEPILEDGIPKTSPKLYLELHRANHLDPVKHVTLGPKSPHQEMMGPYWHHKLASKFATQLKPKKDFYIRASKCAYQ